MKYSLKLEAIGGVKPWVAEITGLSEKFAFERVFIKAAVDYTNANSVGSRGVEYYYLLDEGPLYEVSSQYNWKKKKRYFARIENGELKKLTVMEARAFFTKGEEVCPV